MPRHTPPEAVLFDLDGTLIRWDGDADGGVIEPYRPYLEQALRAAQAAFPSFEEAPDDFVAAVDATMQGTLARAAESLVCVPFDEIVRRTFESCGLALTDEHLAALLGTCRWPLDPRASLQPAAAEVLDELRGRGFALGVVSNALMSGSTRAQELEALGILDYFDVVLTSADARWFKPHAGIFRFAVDRLGCPPNAAVMVGDSLAHDVRGAAAAGLEAIWYAPDGHDSHGATPNEGEVAIRSLTELLDRLGEPSSRG